MLWLVHSLENSLINVQGTSISFFIHTMVTVYLIYYKYSIYYSRFSFQLEAIHLLFETYL